MRETLYRGKRADNGKWAYGYLLVDEITGQHFIFPNGNSCNESQKIGEEGYLRFVAFEVDPSTVGQYTGIPDKNMVKIFEGDIINIYDPFLDRYTKKAEVLWSEIDLAFVVRNDNYNYDANLGNYYGNNCVVIGNIHDNPELLEGGRK